MSTSPAATAQEFTAANIKGVHLNVRNTKTWSNQELRKRCRLTELTAYAGTPQEGGGGGGGEDDRPVIE